jgi:hypothetical protein
LLDNTGITDANAIAALFGLTDGFAGFATIGTGTGTDFIQTNNLLLNGDFATTLDGGAVAPAILVRGQEVPEPASLIIWGSLTALGAVAYRRRKTLKA